MTAFKDAVPALSNFLDALNISSQITVAYFARVCSIMHAQVAKLQRLRNSNKRLPRYGGWELLS